MNSKKCKSYQTVCVCNKVCRYETQEMVNMMFTEKSNTDLHKAVVG